MSAITKDKPAIATAPLRLNLGSGTVKVEGFLSVDKIDFAGVDVVADLRFPWPWPDNSVAEVRCDHTVEHLTALERIWFANELYRVLEPLGKATITVPHWGSGRAYGDPTHQWPPVCEMWLFYLSREWRLGAEGKPANAPHTDISHWPEGFACDFESSWGYGLLPEISLKSQDAQQFAVRFYREAIQDMVATLTARK